MGMLVSFWDSLRKTEHCVEEVRQQLSQREEFSYEKAFKSLDYDLDGSVTTLDVRTTSD